MYPVYCLKGKKINYVHVFTIQKKNQIPSSKKFLWLSTVSRRKKFLHFVYNALHGMAVPTAPP